MAYGVRWQINFAARNNDKFRVEILQDGYNGDIVYLQGDASPFETEEDASSDLFSTIRTQTGTIRIRDNGFDLDGNEFDYTEMIPYDTFDNQVRLWQIGENGDHDLLRWIGYMRPDSLTSELFDLVPVREFQCQCPLSVLYDTPLEFTNNETNVGTFLTIGQILYKALGGTGVDWEYVYKQNNVQHREDLLAKLSLINFIDKNEPTHSGSDNIQAKWKDEKTSFGAVVDEICKFWGWVLYSRGLDIYIVTPMQNAGFAKFAFSDFTSESNSSLTAIDPVELDLDDLGYASTNHNECRLLGYRDISIEADVNEQSEVINPDYQKLDFSFWPVAGNQDQIIHQDNNAMYVLRRLGTVSDQRTSRKEYIDNYEIYENRRLQTLGIESQFTIIYTDGWNNENYADKTEFNFKKGICCWKGGQTGWMTYYAKTLEDICVPLNSVICIDASAMLSYDPNIDAGNSLEGRTVLVSLQIGNKYWDANNNLWTIPSDPTSPPKFGLTVRSDGSITTPQNTFINQGFTPTGILFDNHFGSKGYCIYVAASTNNSNGLCGRMILKLYATPDSPTSYDINFVLNSLSVEIFTPDDKVKPVNKSTQKYSGTASTRFKENMSLNLSLASGSTNKYGRGQLYNSNYSALTNVPFRIGNSSEFTSVSPESRLLARLKSCYGDVTEQDTIEISDNFYASLPSTTFDNHWNSEDVFRLISCSHKWVDATMKLTIVNR